VRRSRHRSEPGAGRRHPTMITYVVAFVALLVLTTLTFALSFLPHGAWSVPVAVAIALVKSALVALFFMHLIEEPVSSWAAFVIAFLLVATLIGLALLDVTSRWLVHPPA